MAWANSGTASARWGRTTECIGSAWLALAVLFGAGCSGSNGENAVTLGTNANGQASPQGALPDPSAGDRAGAAHGEQTSQDQSGGLQQDPAADALAGTHASQTGVEDQELPGDVDAVNTSSVGSVPGTLGGAELSEVPEINTIPADDTAAPEQDIDPAAASVSIAGRWGMAGFEDPVGAEFLQAGPALSGKGCAGGTPAPEQLDSFCGDIAGQVEAREGRFWFSFEAYVYLAEVNISEDGQRMTGRFHGVYDFLDYPTAWLRVAADENWLSPFSESGVDPELLGRYSITLVENQTGGNDYVLGETYRLGLNADDGISGSLGSFWWSEAVMADGVLSVGPVSPTTPELPVELEIEVPDSMPQRVKATTAGGDVYRFEVSLP